MTRERQMLLRLFGRRRDAGRRAPGARDIRRARRSWRQTRLMAVSRVRFPGRDWCTVAAACRRTGVAPDRVMAALWAGELVGRLAAGRPFGVEVCRPSLEVWAARGAPPGWSASAAQAAEAAAGG